MLDVDGSGTLTWDELEVFIGSLATVSDKIVAASNSTELTRTALASIDRDHDGVVSKDEWHRYISGMYATQAERKALFGIVESHHKMARAQLARAQASRTMFPSTPPDHVANPLGEDGSEDSE